MTMPTLATRSDASYLGFVESLREFILNEQSGLDRDIDAMFEREQRGDATRFRELDEVAAVMERTGVGPVRNRLMRSQQEMLWRAIVRGFEPRRAQLESELEEYATRGPGMVLLDPGFVTPAYANVHFHLQPAGYHKDPLAGFHYHYATKVFFRGLNDADQIHRGVAKLTPRPQDGRVDRILDIGCSIGQSTTALKEVFPEAEAWGIDHSAPMLRYAHRKAVQAGLDVNFAQRLAEASGFPDAHFDIAYSMILFHEIPTRIARDVIAEMARVLRRGGIFVIHDFVPSGTSTPLQLYHRDYDSRYNGEPYADGFCHSDLPAMLQSAGFTIRRIIPDGYGYMNTWWADRT